MTPRFVITGTDTGVGKTVFAAALAAALDATYWKPVQAGLEDGGDAELVRRLSGLPGERILPEAYRLTTPCSPHRAARIDGITIDPDHLVPPTVHGPLVIEGAGGALVPLTGTMVYADMFERWGLPVIIVARTTLGTINHSLLTIEALRRRQIMIHGIAFVGEANEDSEEIICEIGEVRRLGRLGPLAPLTPATLARGFADGFDVTDFRS
jgi:dethiobiotin synthetase